MMTEVLDQLIEDTFDVRGLRMLEKVADRMRGVMLRKRESALDYALLREKAANKRIGFTRCVIREGV